MIDYERQAEDRLEAPGVPDDIKYLGDSLRDIAHWVKKSYDALRRQESPNPTLITLNPDGAGTNTGRIRRNSAQMRAYALQFSGGTTIEEFALFVGTAAVFNWIVPVSPAPFTVPLDIVLPAGVDIQIRDLTTATAVNWRGYIWAYTELEEGGDA